MYLHIKISLFSAAATLVLGKGHLVTLSNEKKKGLPARYRRVCLALKKNVALVVETVQQSASAKLMCIVR